MAEMPPNGVSTGHDLKACHHCFSIQRLPDHVPPGHEVVCCGCGAPFLTSAQVNRAWEKTSAFALTALILLLPSLFLPIMELETFGHRHASGIIAGVMSLFQEGHFVLGGLILVCSVLFPLAKLSLLLFLSHSRDRLSTGGQVHLLHLLETAGRWGMLDVLLIAILVAAVKLGNMLHITPGPAALLFTLAVCCSLLAGSAVNPDLVWHSTHRKESDDV